MKSKKYDEWEVPEIDDWDDDDDDELMRNEDRQFIAIGGFGGGFSCRPRFIFGCRPTFFFGCRPRFYFGCRPRQFGFGFCYPRQFYNCFPRPCYPI